MSPAVCTSCLRSPFRPGSVTAPQLEARPSRMHDIGRNLALSAISFYQRFLSPHKGFRCAYAQHTGSASCSQLGYRAIRRFGVGKGVGLLFQRFDRCRAAYLDHRSSRSAASRVASGGFSMAAGPRRLQRGFCEVLACVPDAGCAAAPCEAGCSGGSMAIDAANCCCSVPWPSSCDPWPRKRSSAQTRLFVDGR